MNRWAERDRVDVAVNIPGRLSWSSLISMATASNETDNDTSEPSVSSENSSRTVKRLKEQMLTALLGDPKALELFQDEGFKSLMHSLNPRLPSLDPLPVMQEMTTVLKEQARLQLTRRCSHRFQPLLYDLAIFPFRFDTENYVTVELMYTDREGNSRRSCPVACLRTGQPEQAGDETAATEALRSLVTMIGREVADFGVTGKSIAEVVVWGERWRPLRENLRLGLEVATPAKDLLSLRGKLTPGIVAHLLQSKLTECSSRLDAISKMLWPGAASEVLPPAAAGHHHHKVRGHLERMERKAGNLRRRTRAMSEQTEQAEVDLEYRVYYACDRTGGGEGDCHPTLLKSLPVRDYEAALDSVHSELNRLHRQLRQERSEVAACTTTTPPSSTEAAFSSSTSTTRERRSIEPRQDGGEQSEMMEILSHARRTFSRMESYLDEGGAIWRRYQDVCQTCEHFRRQNAEEVRTPHALQILKHASAHHHPSVSDRRWMTVGFIRAMCVWLGNDAGLEPTDNASGETPTTDD